MACLTFLTIPLDVRENVLELAVFTPYNPYHIPFLAEGARQPPIRRPVGQHKFFTGWSWNSAPCYLSYELGESFASHKPTLILSLVNRQLKDEVSTLIRRTQDRPEYHRCTLDILFVNEQNLWPTWTCLPPCPIVKSGAHVVISQVDVTFRIVGEGEPCRSIFRSGDGSPPPIELCVYHVLERFLRAGPFLKNPDETKADINYNIARLNIDFIALLAKGEELYGKDDMQKWQEENRNVASSHTSTLDSATEVPATKKIMRPQWLASFILSGLRNVTRMTYHTALFGTLLYERVGDIHVTIINGEEQELLLDELLQTLNPTDSGDTFGNLSREERLSYFIRLKKETQERRSRLFGEKSARYGLENMASDVA